MITSLVLKPFSFFRGKPQRHALHKKTAYSIAGNPPVKEEPANNNND